MKKVLLASIVCSLSSVAMANSAGDHVIHGGILSVNPDSGQNTIMLDTLAGPRATPHKATVDSAITLGFGYDYYVTDNIAVGLMLGIPPKHDVVSVSTGQAVGDVTQISPEIKAKYLFGTPESKFRPFVGGGIAYVKLEGEITDPAFQGLLGKKVDIDAKLAPVVSAGVQYNINDRMSISGSLSYMFLEPQVRFPDAPAAASPAVRKVYTDAVINPVVGYVAFGYSF